MIAANLPVQRPPDAKLLVVDRAGRVTDAPRSRLIEFLQPADLVIANDAATLPASLQGVHVATGAEIEVRLAGWPRQGSMWRPTSVGLLADGANPAAAFAREARFRLRLSYGGPPKPCPPSREALRRDLDEARRAESGRRLVGEPRRSSLGRRRSEAGRR
jgi:hypothetical protein